MKLQYVLSLHVFWKKINLRFEAFSWIVILPSKGQSNILSPCVMTARSLLPQQRWCCHLANKYARPHAGSCHHQSENYHRPN